MRSVSPEVEAVLAEIRDLAKREGARCLWFMREDLTIDDAETAREVLRQVAKSGDKEAFARAARLRVELARALAVSVGAMSQGA